MAESYQVFGLRLETGFDFSARLPCGGSGREIRFDRAPDLGEALRCPHGPPVYSSSLRGPRGGPVLQVFEKDGAFLLSFPGVAVFSVGTDGISYSPAPPERRDLIEVRFLGTVLAFFLERSGVPVLHASAVDVDGRAVAFLGNNRGGKTGLAASFLRAGFSLLGDDLAPLDAGSEPVMVRPGIPQMKAWPDLAHHLLGGIEGLPRVLETIEKRWIPVGPPAGFGSFCGEPRPLGSVYLPRREEASAQVRIEALRPRDAVVELLRTSFLARLVDALGWQPRRLDLLSRLAAATPVRRLVYPAGFEHLDRVRDAVLADLLNG